MVQVRRPLISSSGHDEDSGKITTLAELRAFLEKFQPRCLQPKEDPMEHMLYAGKVALAQQLLSLTTKGFDPY